MTHAVSLSGVSCVFQSGGRLLAAVDDVSLDIEPGEFFTLLGPSGSGKTTCLRMIGGFTTPTKGSISICGEAVGDRPPYLRPVTTVFQDYALFPHMSVLDNVAYALMVKGIGRAQRHRRAQELLELVRLPDISLRKPAQLSGGQRQRVALARALVSEPKVLLLDEPLGALDLKLREQMQGELKELQRRLGITFVLVTHDQHEALSMSDRIGVFNRGRIEQVATPTELYERPATRFVAQFLGAANLLDEAEARRLCGRPSAMIRPERIRLVAGNGSNGSNGGTDGSNGDHGGSGISSTSTSSTSSASSATGTVQGLQYFGAFWRVNVARDGASHLLVDLAPQAARPAPGARVQLHWDASAVHPLDDPR